MMYSCTASSYSSRHSEISLPPFFFFFVFFLACSFTFFSAFSTSLSSDVLLSSSESFFFFFFSFLSLAASLSLLSLPLNLPKLNPSFFFGLESSFFAPLPLPLFSCSSSFLFCIALRILTSLSSELSSESMPIPFIDAFWVLGASPSVSDSPFFLLLGASESSSESSSFFLPLFLAFLASFSRFCSSFSRFFSSFARTFSSCFFFFSSAFFAFSSAFRSFADCFSAAFSFSFFCISLFFFFLSVSESVLSSTVSSFPFGFFRLPPVSLLLSLSVVLFLPCLDRLFCNLIADSLPLSSLSSLSRLVFLPFLDLTLRLLSSLSSELDVDLDFAAARAALSFSSTFFWSSARLLSSFSLSFSSFLCSSARLFSSSFVFFSSAFCCFSTCFLRVSSSLACLFSSSFALIASFAIVTNLGAAACAFFFFKMDHSPLDFVAGGSSTGCVRISFEGPAVAVGRGAAIVTALAATAVPASCNTNIFGARVLAPVAG
mmetsp:Transcript_74119/g.130826  ORF Transcript_74119/g.130826 Transcript_74119/m.130826 type:complete len:488 (-) Transcript_74119:782-2245(-)